MKLSKAEWLAKRLIRKHSVSAKFAWSNTKLLVGDCVFTSPLHTIRLSRLWVPLLPEEQVTDTILHELAHSKAGWEDNHGKIWVYWALMFGANPNPDDLSDIFYLIQKNHYRYMANCQCQDPTYFDKMTWGWKEKVYYCLTCNDYYSNMRRNPEYSSNPSHSD